MMAGAKGEVSRHGDDVAARELLLHGGDLLGTAGGDNDQPVAHSNGLRRLGGEGGPVLLLHLAHAAAEVLVNLERVLLPFAKDFHAGGLAPRDFSDDEAEMRRTGESLLPGIRPFGGGELGPDVHDREWLE